MILILMRHGESEHNVDGVFDTNIYSGVNLTDKGREQIIKASNDVAMFLKNNHHLTKVNRVYSSPMLRTFQSTCIFMDTIKRHKMYSEDRFCLDYRIIEMDMGDFDRKPVSEYPYDNFEKNHDFNGETSYDVYKRVVSFYNHLNDYNINVVISHCEPMKQLIKHTTGKTLSPEKGVPMYIDTYCGAFIE